MLDHIGERLCADEVGGLLHLGWQPAGRYVDHDWARDGFRKISDGSGQALIIKQAWVHAAAEGLHNLAGGQDTLRQIAGLDELADECRSSLEASLDTFLKRGRERAPFGVGDGHQPES